MQAAPSDHQLSGVLSEFARTMLTDFPIHAILDHLVRRIVDILPITSAGVTLISVGSDPHYIAASDPAALRFEQLQSELGEGPCMTAYEADEAISIADLRHDVRFPRFAARAVEAGLIATFSFPLRHGERRFGALALYRSTAGALDQPTMAAAQTLADVAAAYLLNAQARLDLGDSAARTERLAAIVESSFDSIISWTSNGVITSWNPESERMYGYSADEAIGQDLTLIVPPDRLGEIVSVHARVIRGATVNPLETQRRRRDGSVVDVAEMVSPITDRGGAIVGLSAVGRDISESRRTIEALDASHVQRQSLQGQLRQSQRLDGLGQLAGGVAHEFNNLLAVIHNYATFVAEAVGADDEVQHDVAQILAASQRGVRLTRQLLQFAHREPVEPVTLDLNALVGDLRDLLARSIGTRIHMVVNAGADLPTFSADKGQADQVLLNLVLNARDAMPEGGDLTIDTALVTLQAGDPRLHPAIAPGRFLQLRVSDEGVGMLPEVASRAFEPFFTTKARTEGTGLGLATVYGIVTEAGGAVQLTSTEGAGTMVTVLFPATDGAALPHESMEERLQGRGETVLVVEDQAAVRAVTRRMLARNGYVVMEAASGSEALTKAAGRKIDLLLTDVVMPLMSGSQLAERLAGRQPGLAVLYMSGYAPGGLDDRVALIAKPFDEAALLRRVRETLS